jgi:hypothetical protein
MEQDSAATAALAWRTDDPFCARWCVAVNGKGKEYKVSVLATGDVVVHSLDGLGEVDNMVGMFDSVNLAVNILSLVPKGGAS